NIAHCYLSRLVRSKLSIAKECGPASTSIKPRPLGRPLMRDGAAGRLADQTCIFCERACPMSWRSRLPHLAPPRQSAIVDQNIHAARSRIDADTIAIADQRQWTADEGLRRDIANAHPTRRP